jgi:predicted dehydrogenase
LILGTGDWANRHAQEYAAIEDAMVVAAVDSRPDVLRVFLETHDIEQGFSSLEEALAWGEFDAASNVTPDAVHHATTLALLAAGRHVMCEKPLATNQAHAREMADAANATGLVNMVNLRYRAIPSVEKARQLVAEGAIGQIRHFEASYFQSWLMQPAWGEWKTDPKWLWRVSTAHGSNGVLGDIGIHVLDFVTAVANSQPVDTSWRLKTFAKMPDNRIGTYILDANDSFVMHAELANGAIGSISATRFAAGHHNDLRLRIYGDLGGLEVLYEKDTSRLNGCLGDAALTETWQEIPTEPVPSMWQRFVTAIRDGTAAEPDFNHGAMLQGLLDEAMQSRQADR